MSMGLWASRDAQDDGDGATQTNGHPARQLHEDAVLAAALQEEEAMLASLDISVDAQASEADLLRQHNAQNAADSPTPARPRTSAGPSVSQIAAVGAAGGSSASAGRFIVLKRMTPNCPHYVTLTEFNASTKEVGLGCWDLRSPPQAIAACWQSHAHALGGTALAETWEAAADGYEIPSGNCTLPFSQNRGFKFAKTEANGDCFYDSVRCALETIGVEVTVAELRAVVAAKLTTENWELAQVDPPWDLEHHVHTFDAFQARVRESGGAWADDFAIATVREHLRLSAVLLIDVEAPKGSKYTRILV